MAASPRSSERAIVPVQRLALGSDALHGQIPFEPLQYEIVRPIHLGGELPGRLEIDAIGHVRQSIAEKLSIDVEPVTKRREWQAVRPVD